MTSKALSPPTSMLPDLSLLKSICPRAHPPPIFSSEPERALGTLDATHKVPRNPGLPREEH